MQIQIAMDRERLSEEKKCANTEMEREKFRSNLLCAISHDLRTPLAGISGTAEVLTYSLKRMPIRTLHTASTKKQPG
jgi:two-component system sensor histidine kinase KdpD